jgi:hypothetical protein
MDLQSSWYSFIFLRSLSILTSKNIRTLFPNPFYLLVPVSFITDVHVLPLQNWFLEPKRPIAFLLKLVFAYSLSLLLFQS